MSTSSRTLVHRNKLVDIRLRGFSRGAFDAGGRDHSCGFLALVFPRHHCKIVYLLLIEMSALQRLKDDELTRVKGIPLIKYPSRP
jgi:hypothetical protein